MAAGVSLFLRQLETAIWILAIGGSKIVLRNCLSCRELGWNAGGGLQGGGIEVSGLPFSTASALRLAGGCSGNPVVRDPLRARSRSS